MRAPTEEKKRKEKGVDRKSPGVRRARALLPLGRWCGHCPEAACDARPQLPAGGALSDPGRTLRGETVPSRIPELRAGLWERPPHF